MPNPKVHEWLNSRLATPLMLAKNLHELLEEQEQAHDHTKTATGSGELSAAISLAGQLVQQLEVVSAVHRAQYEHAS